MVLWMCMCVRAHTQVQAFHNEIDDEDNNDDDENDDDDRLVNRRGLKRVYG